MKFEHKFKIEKRNMYERQKSVIIITATTINKYKASGYMKRKTRRKSVFLVNCCIKYV